MRAASISDVDSLSTGLSQELLREIVDSIIRHAAPKRIILYGSRARGNYAEASDIDIAVECDDGADFIRNEIDDDVRTLLKLEIVNMNHVSKQLRMKIERKGIILYEKA